MHLAQKVNVEELPGLLARSIYRVLVLFFCVGVGIGIGIGIGIDMVFQVILYFIFINHFDFVRSK